MLLFYIRHGEPIYNPNRLTELGQSQAEALSKRLALAGITKIYSSDSNRSIQTAMPTSKLLNLKIEKLPWCNESLSADEFNALKDKGSWAWAFEHAPTIKKFNSTPIRNLGEKWYDYEEFKHLDYKKGVLRIQKEADAFLDNLGFTHDRGNRIYYANKKGQHDRVALFAHQGFGLAFLSSILDIPYPEFCTHFDFGHSSYSVIEFKENDGGFVCPIMIQFSNDSHIYKENLPLKYQSRIEF